MSQTFRRVKRLVGQGKIRISAHGYDELAAEGTLAADIIQNLAEAAVIEDYPDYSKGPCVLVLERGADGRPLHVVWGIPRGTDAPAVLVTAYRPDPAQWNAEFMRRKP